MLCLHSRTIMRYLKWGLIGFVALLAITVAWAYPYEKAIENPGIFNKEDFSRYDILLSDSVIRELDELRKEGLEKMDFSDVKIRKKAKVIIDGDTLEAFVKLKGDLPDHYDSDQYSLRVMYTDRDSAIRVVSLQHPKTRRYISELIFHKLLKQEDMLFLNYDFVTVYINGNYKGFYAAEEHFSNHNIEEKWGLPHGAILGFRDDFYWPQGMLPWDQEFDTKTYKAAEIKCFNCNNEDQSDLYQTAIDKLYNYQNGKLKAHEVFDLDQMAKYYAICDLTGASHALRWLNCRYYYNTEKQRFQPAGFDSNGHRINRIALKNFRMNTAHHGRIFADPNFKTAYKNYLKHYSDLDFIDEFFEKNYQEFNKYNSAFIHTNEFNCSPNMKFFHYNRFVIIAALVFSI